jgi:hypothetical protein
MKIATKKATTILNEDAQKGGLMVSREWSKDENGVPFQLTDELCKEDEEELQTVNGNLIELIRKKQSVINQQHYLRKRCQLLTRNILTKLIFLTPNN